MRIRRLAGATALATFAASLTLFASPSPAQAADSVILPVTSHWQTLADNHHVYVSAPGDDAVVATDHDGRVLKTVEGLDGARGMTLSGDESTLYVALPDADAIAAIDTTTLTETRRFATGSDTEPENLAVAGGKLWFSYQATVFDAGIGSISVADTDPVVELDRNPVWYGKPRLASSPARPDRLVAAESTGAPGMRTYDVSSGSAQEVAYTDAAFRVDDLAITPDGETAVTAA
ncbi:YncE family protein [Streptomyces sp. NPDC088354]|uniref:YncE family protein n=1 Tax=Streptomyces sp. NPDC088354 TaxID=3365856 RepID=UPI003823D772